MSMVSRADRRELDRANAKLSPALQEIPKADWPAGSVDSTRLRVWRSRRWLVQEFAAPAPALVRLSIIRTSRTATGWEESVNWEELQALKNEVGYRWHDAVEIYPAADDVVNVSNMRHLWIMAEPLSFAWRQA